MRSEISSTLFVTSLSCIHVVIANRERNSQLHLRHFIVILSSYHTYADAHRGVCVVASSSIFIHDVLPSRYSSLFTSFNLRVV